MITQIQGVSVTCDQPLASPVDLEQYLTQQADISSRMYLHNPPSLGLQQSSQNILHFALALATEKKLRKRKDYKQLLNNWGWEKEDKKYLKLATVFEKFDPLDLATIEPDTLFLLAKNNKKYQPVIDELLDTSFITQERVRELMKQQRKPRRAKTETSSIWRPTDDGGRYLQIPPIHNQETGVKLQTMIEEEGLTVQSIVSEGISLRDAYKQGRLIWVSDIEQLSDTEGDKEIEVESILNPQEFVNGVVHATRTECYLASEDIASHDNDGFEDSFIPSDKTQEQESSEANTKSELVEDNLLSAQTIAEQLIQTTTWSEVVEITLPCDNEIKVSAWQLLDEAERKRLHEMKRKFESGEEIDVDSYVSIPKGEGVSETVTKNIQVGDKVIWSKSPVHLNSWSPFIITKIEGDKAMLDIYMYPVSLAELVKVSEKG